MAELKLKTAQNRTFLMVQSSDHITGAAGLSPLPTLTISKNGGPLLSLGGTITEIGNGFYNAALLPSDTDTLGDLAFHCTASGADPQDFIDQVVQNCEIVNLIAPTFLAGSQYANRIIAQWYFNQRLGTGAWDSASSSDQDKALTQATKLIDNLNFSGKKTNSTQILQFPRGGDTVIPESIIEACCEIALVLLDDVDVNQEMKNVNAQEHRFAATIVRRDPAVPPEWLLAGIPSPIAWNLLKPFLRDPRQIELSRID